jgi:hypothetical protein
MTATDTTPINVYSDSRAMHIRIPWPDDLAAELLPADLDALWAEVRRLRADANTANSAYGKAAAGLDSARQADVEAGAVALRAGKRDPGRAGETKVAEDMADARRAAEVAYRAALAAGEELLLALRSIDRATRQRIATELQARHDAAQAAAREHLDGYRTARSHALEMITALEWVNATPEPVVVGIDTAGPWRAVHGQIIDDLERIARAGRNRTTPDDFDDAA